MPRLPSSTSLEACGMSGISPIALEEAIKQTKSNTPTLVHPSLQGELFPKSEFFSRAKISKYAWRCATRLVAVLVVAVAAAVVMVMMILLGV